MNTTEPGRGAVVLKRVSDLAEVLLQSSACLETVGLKSMGLLIISGNATLLARELATAASQMADENSPAPESISVTLPDGLDLTAFADLVLAHSLKTAPAKAVIGTSASSNRH
ncbi:MAG TPA: hypothetical protein PKZ32_17640 [Candidatus Melainabacteria bacterium]|nr:hypothetical protein [Candidatus Melainabacteria bacterium]